MIVNKGMYDKQFTDVELADGSKVTLTLKPLPAIELKKLMNIAKVFGKTGENSTNEDIMNGLTSEGVFEDVVDVVTKTILKSYPEWGKEVTDEFVSINLFVLISLVFDTNFPNKG